MFFPRFALSTALAAAIACFLPSTTTCTSVDALQLQHHVEELLGNDERLMRWDATEHTAQSQEEECRDLESIFGELVAKTAAKSLDAKWLYLAMEFGTLCMIDNQSNRDSFSKVTDVYQAITNLIKLHHAAGGTEVPTSDYHLHRLPAKAAQLVYVAVFGNKANHQGFYSKADGVISALMAILVDYATTLDDHLDHMQFQDAIEFGQGIEENAPEKPKTTSTLPITAMWAAAALQNMAASYCDTEDLRCYWDWSKNDEGHYQLQKANDSGSIISDGHKMRKSMMEIGEEDFWAITMDSLVCHMPGDETPTLHDSEHAQPVDSDGWLVQVTKAVLYASHDPTKKARREYLHLESDHDSDHERLETLVAWAAAGLIKNVAIEMSTSVDMLSTIIDNFDHLTPCLCQLTQSKDWLERGKAHQALLRLRRSDPCWFEDDMKTTLPRGIKELNCVDQHFTDGEGKHCGDYGDDQDAACNSDYEDELNLISAKEACCACGGGLREDMDEMFGEEL